MGSLNRAQVIGNLGRDAELRYTQGGQAVANFSVATTEKWTDKQTGEQKEQTQWHRCVLWGKTAESLAQYLLKGKQVYCDGRLQTRDWEDKDGHKRQTTEINVDKVVLLGGARNGREDQPSRHDESGPQEQAQASPDATAQVIDDDIPF
jgi:single-strand DNA-binding protein